jgi:hypothetical protein
LPIAAPKRASRAETQGREKQADLEIVKQGQYPDKSMVSKVFPVCA